MLAFFVGRIIPADRIDAGKFPFRPFAFEKDGRVYNAFGIRKWQNKVPDMSKIFTRIMPAKNLSGDYKERLPRMIQETCVAEMIHAVLGITSLFCLKLYPGAGGIIIVTLYLVFNLLFIMIQRYNRPKLIKVMKRAERTAAKEKEESVDRTGDVVFGASQS